jgi:hypothetical protein
MFQRSATCAGVLPSFSAIEMTTGSLRTLPLLHVEPGEPSGEYACKIEKQNYKHKHQVFQKKKVQIPLASILTGNKI